MANPKNATETKPAPAPMGSGASAPTAGPGRPAVDPNESKADAWKRIATARTSDALRSIQGLRKIANPSNYDWTTEQREKVFTALRAEIDAAEAQYKNPTKTKQVGFNL